MSYGDYQPIRNFEGISYSLGYLRSWHGLQARCASCGRQTMLDLEVARRRHGKDIAAADLAKKIKCSKCGNRVGNTLTLCKRRQD